MKNSEPSLPAVGKNRSWYYTLKIHKMCIGLGYFSEQAFESVHHNIKVKLTHIKTFKILIV